MTKEERDKSIEDLLIQGRSIRMTSEMLGVSPFIVERIRDRMIRTGVKVSEKKKAAIPPDGFAEEWKRETERMKNVSLRQGYISPSILGKFMIINGRWEFVGR